MNSIYCDCGNCSGCLWDRSNDCTGESDCDCRRCRPFQKRFKVSPYSSVCCCVNPPSSCNCYGCFSCLKEQAKISHQVDMMISAIMASSMRTSLAISMPVPAAVSVPPPPLPLPPPPVPVPSQTNINDEPWTVVRSKRSKRFSKYRS